MTGLKADDVPQYGFVRPRPVADAAGRLITFPFAGAAAVAYHPWAAALPPQIELVSLQYRGRGRLRHLSPRTSIADVVADCHEAVSMFLDAPFCLLGHSFGATVAFEVTRRLRSGAQRLPEALVVSARPAPQLPIRPGRTRLMSDDEFMAHLLRYGGMREEILRSRDLMAMIMPLLRADLSALDDWRYLAQAPLAVPLIALGGDEDATVSPDALRAWSEMSSAEFECHLLPGGHFFLQDQSESVLAILRAFMRRRGAVGWGAN